MYVKDLQEFLSKFTEGQDGRQGNALSNAVIFVEKNGYLEEISKMEIHENASPIIGQKRAHTAHRLVLKTETARKLLLPDKLRGDI